VTLTTVNAIDIKPDDLSRGDVIELLEQHLRDMYATSPPENVHALDVDALKAPSITFYSAHIQNVLAGCVALNKLNDDAVELKSMRVCDAFRGHGVGKALLTYILKVAAEKHYKKVLLETGTQDFFEPARSLYASFGFQFQGPFSHYLEDPHSCFMSLSFSQDAVMLPCDAKVK
jgi:putative acetyltransferase